MDQLKEFEKILLGSVEAPRAKNEGKDILDYEKGLVNFGIQYNSFEKSDYIIDFKEDCAPKRLYHVRRRLY